MMRVKKIHFVEFQDPQNCRFPPQAHSEFFYIHEETMLHCRILKTNLRTWQRASVWLHDREAMWCIRAHTMYTTFWKQFKVCFLRSEVWLWIYLKRPQFRHGCKTVLALHWTLGRPLIAAVNIKLQFGKWKALSSMAGIIRIFSDKSITIPWYFYWPK